MLLLQTGTGEFQLSHTLSCRMSRGLPACCSPPSQPVPVTWAHSVPTGQALGNLGKLWGGEEVWHRKKGRFWDFVTLTESPGLAGSTSLWKPFQLQTWLARARAGNPASLRETVPRPLLSPLRHASRESGFRLLSLLNTHQPLTHKNKCSALSLWDTMDSTEGSQR